MIKNRNKFSNLSTHIQQKGYILIVGLLLLVVLNVIGLSAMQSSVMEEKMAFNIKDRNVAFQASESALRTAEEWLQEQVLKPQAVSGVPVGDQIWSLNAKDTVDFDGKNWWFDRTDEWWESTGKPVTDTSLQTAKPPRYVIEELAKTLPSGASLVVGGNENQEWNFHYRVTTKGIGGQQGGDSQARVMLQSVYIKKHDG